jgi:hypothetical protein
MQRRGEAGRGWEMTEEARLRENHRRVDGKQAWLQTVAQSFFQAAS